ncbi:MAG: hypothetical protein AAGE93_14190 [Bacteroidota bacterium]
MSSLNFKSVLFRQLCLMASVLSVLSCGSTQQVVIPPQQTFIVASGDQGAYKVKITNQGRAAVRIAEKLEHGELIDQGFLLSGDRRRLSFLLGSEAVFSNTLSDTVYLRLRILGSSEPQTRIGAVQ